MVKDSVSKRMAAGEPEAYPHEYRQGKDCPIVRQAQECGWYIDVGHSCEECKNYLETQPDIIKKTTGYEDTPRRKLR